MFFPKIPRALTLHCTGSPLVSQHRTSITTSTAPHTHIHTHTHTLAFALLSLASPHTRLSPPHCLSPHNNALHFSSSHISFSARTFWKHGVTSPAGNHAARSNGIMLHYHKLLLHSMYVMQVGGGIQNWLKIHHYTVEPRSIVPACTVRNFWSRIKFHINNIIYSRIHRSPNYRFPALIVCKSRSRRSISRVDRLKKKIEAKYLLMALPSLWTINLATQ